MLNIIWKKNRLIAPQMFKHWASLIPRSDMTNHQESSESIENFCGKLGAVISHSLYHYDEYNCCHREVDDLVFFFDEARRRHQNTMHKHEKERQRQPGQNWTLVCHHYKIHYFTFLFTINNATRVSEWKEDLYKSISTKYITRRTET